MRRDLLSAVLSLSVLLSTLVAAHAASYTFTTIDVPNASRTLAFGINDGGQIVGFYEGASGYHGFLYDSGIFTPLDIPFAGAATGTTRAFGLNNRGQIVGAYSAQSRDHGFLYVDSAFTSLPEVPFAGAFNTTAQGINNGGQIVGYFVDQSGQHGFLYSAGVFTPFDAPSGGATISAFDINNRGQIVGFYTDMSGGTHGFLATPTKK